MTRGSKTTSPVPEKKAESVFERLISEKRAKGYQDAPGISGKVFDGESEERTIVPSETLIPVSAKEETGIIPQLLTPITEPEAEHFIRNKAYGAQEKKDGNRRFLRNDGLRVIGMNRKGQVVEISPSMSESVAALGPVLLDGESIGDVFHAFGLLELGQDLRHLPYCDAHKKLSELVSPEDPIIKVVPLYKSEADKRALFKRLKQENREGIVFKSLVSTYFPGRDPRHLKCKFCATATVICTGAHHTKRSVSIAVLNMVGDMVPIGNVSVPTNYNMPGKGDPVEVKYLYAYPNGSLFQPVYLGVRDDIEIEECLQEQLKYKSEEAA